MLSLGRALIFIIATLMSAAAMATLNPLHTYFQTQDGVRIASDFYPQGAHLAKTLLIVAPGFAQSKDSQVMKSLCQNISQTSNVDVLCFDFRGTGGSSGTYNFGADEPLDIAPLLAWGNANYKKVNILGLSMGAYTAVRAGYLWPKFVSKLLLVSCPPDFLDIITSGGVLGEIIHFVLNPTNAETQTDANWLFNWGNPFSPEPNLIDLAKQVRTPAAFLVGQDDPLVRRDLTQSVYLAMAGPRSWTVFPAGDHAEAMYVQNPTAFVQWIKNNL